MTLTETALASADISFKAMGSDCFIQVTAQSEDAASRLASLAKVRVSLLEKCWTRFSPQSELSRLNFAAGLGQQKISPDLAALIAAMASAWKETNGLYDPTILPAILASGYTEDYEKVKIRKTHTASSWNIPAPGMSGVTLAKENGAWLASLPAAVGIDPGGIGKGLAGDIVCAELMNAGADGVLTSLGGDVVATGTGPTGQWTVGIDGFDWQVSAGPEGLGVATSTTLKRSWGKTHHIINPKTGTKAEPEFTQATVIAASGAEAEAAASAALLASYAKSWLESRRLSGFLTGACGKVVVTS